MIKQIFFVKFSLYSVILTLVTLLMLHFLSYIDIMQQFNKITIAMLIISIVGGLFGSFISEYSAD